MNKLLVALVASAFVVTAVLAEGDAVVKVDKVVTLKGTVTVVKAAEGVAAKATVKDAAGKETVLVINDKVEAMNGKTVEISGVADDKGVVTVKEIKEVKVEAPKAPEVK